MAPPAPALAPALAPTLAATPSSRLQRLRPYEYLIFATMFVLLALCLVMAPLVSSPERPPASAPSLLRAW